MLEIDVVPRAVRSEVIVGEGGALRVRLKAMPAGGRANAELVSVLAKALGIPKLRIAIVHGATSRRKRVRVRGLTAEETRKRLELHAKGAAGATDATWN